MADYACAICCCSLHTENPRIFFCSKCYHDWEREIKANVGWVKALRNFESQRRRQDTFMYKGKRVSVQLVYLGDSFDLAMADDGRARLIPTESYYEDNE